MLEEGLTYIDEAERLRLQATVDQRRHEQRRTRARDHASTPADHLPTRQARTASRVGTG